MAIKNSLLKEAIADAKAVKDIAVENAKIALQEAFTPRIQSMLSAKLQNEIEGGDEEVPEEAPVEGGDEGEEVPISDEVPTEEEPMEEPTEEEPMEEPTEEPTEEEPVEEPVEEPAEEESVDEDLELEALIRELEDDAEESIEEGIADESGIGSGDNKKPSADANDSSDIGKKKEKTVGDHAKETKDFLAEEEDPFDGESFGDDSDLDDVEGDGYGEDDGGVDIDEIISQLEEGDDDGEMSEEPEESDEEVDIDEIIAELEEPTKDTTETEKIQGPDSINQQKSLNEVKKLRKENKDLKSELNEYVEAVTFMKNKLNEVNLLNAKLLYTNKLFKSFSLTNEQKMMVVESFDRATNARETKLTYVTLAETLNKTGKKVSKTVNESIQKPVSSTKPAVEKTTQILNESENIARRFRELSGLDKTKMPNYR